MLVDYFGMERCELPVKSIDKVLETIASAVPRWKELIAISFLSQQMKDKYLELLKARVDVINI
jgi:serine/threonine-protein kinase HipA